jgi:signal transduction histidine kinase/ABC-type amino acid transport substrate-binding protein
MRILYLFFAFFLLSVSGFADPASFSDSLPKVHIKVGIYANPPKIFIDQNGKAAGFFVDLLNEIARLENWQIEYVNQPWPLLLQNLKDGKIDLLPDVGHTESRANTYDLNKITVVSDWFQIFSNPKIEIKSLLDLDGYRIAILAGSIQLDYLNNLVKNLDQKLTIVEKDDYETIFNTVAGGEADILVSNRFAGKILGPRYGVKETSLIFNPTSLHFACTKGKKRFILERIDKHLEIWKKDPDSFYYRSLSANLDGVAQSKFIPVWLKNLIVSMLAVIGFSFVTIALFRSQLNKRTSELQQSNVRLEKALNDLQKAYEKAVTQERLNQLGQMVSGISHDFNNILMPINGLTDLMLSDEAILDDKKTVKYYLNTILAASHDGGELVKSMKEFYRINEKKLEKDPVDLNELIQNVITLTSPKWKEQPKKAGISIDIDFNPGKISSIDASRFQIREMIVNLLFNAVDAMPEGGKITIKTSESNDLVNLSIEDTGIGMSPETLTNCFRPFYTTKGEKGTGMGLSMVKEICESHQTRLKINSEPHKGTKFSFAFPKTQNMAKQIEKESISFANTRLKILLVDDNPLVLEVAKAILTSEGHELDPCNSPIEAMKLAVERHYDLVITDFSMPEMTGVKMIKEIRQHKPIQKFVVLTGSNYENSISELEDLQIPVVSKPLNLRSFNKIITRLFITDRVLEPRQS